MSPTATLSDPLHLARGPAWANRITLAPLTNWQSHADGTLGEDEYRWLTMRAPRRLRHDDDLRRARAALGPGLSGAAGRVVRCAPARPDAAGCRHPCRRQRVLPATAAFGPARRARADRPAACRALGRCRDRCPRAEHCRGRAAGARLHRRRAPRRAGRLPGRGAARRARLSAGAVSGCRAQPAQRPLRRQLRQPHAHPVRDHRRHPRRHRRRASSSGCGCRPSASTSA